MGSHSALITLATLLGLSLAPGSIVTAAAPPTVTTPATPLLSQGNQLYQAGQYAAALDTWTQAIAQLGDSPSLDRAQTLTHIALAHLQLGQWVSAQDHIDRSLQTLEQLPPSPQRTFSQGKAHNVQGSLWYSQGHLDQALEAFQAASLAYTAVGDRLGQQQNQLNQAKVLQSQGRNILAQAQLQALQDDLASSPNSPLKAASLRELGTVVRLTSSADRGQALLEESLAVAQSLGDSNEQAATWLQLGSLHQDLGQWDAAHSAYGAVLALNPNPTLQVQALVNQFRVKTRQNPGLWPDLPRDRQRLETALAQAPPNRTSLYAHINYAQSLVDLATEPTAGSSVSLSPQPPSSPALPLAPIAEQLAQAIQTAQALGDPLTEAYGLGKLGHLYAVAGQWPEAQRLTQNALNLAQAANAAESVYQWQWQLGRIYWAQQQWDNADRSYQGAIASLETLRGDLASLNPDARFSFREEIEPSYRQYVSLLLTPRPSSVSQSPGFPLSPISSLKSLVPSLPLAQSPRPSPVTQANLIKARTAIESLQVAELVNFFQADCVTLKSVDVDQVDPKAGIIYTIMLGDRLEVLLSQPGYPIYHQTVAAAHNRIENLVKTIRLNLKDPFGLPKRELQALYRWLIEPLEAELAQRDLETLVFVSDGSLRNLPMAVLYDGEQYLVEKYALALTPGLQLFDPKPLVDQTLGVTIAGVSEARQGFSALPAVLTEVADIQSNIPSQVFLNDKFQKTLVSSQLQTQPSSVVHFATHGQFGSTAEDTFILTWDDKIYINELSELLRSGFIQEDQAIELLVFSACETAEGDDRAVLGLAGLAVRSGARSTLATLWQVDDRATGIFMDHFYTYLSQGTLTKAEAVRQAQLSLMQDQDLAHPFYWAPFVLVGNWL